ncbi:hypothetical protein MMC10_008037 [Thelotrema lepadinum]|nr:hypothetical protein [Thelotrema lepadinum]
MHLSCFPLVPILLELCFIVSGSPLVSQVTEELPTRLVYQFPNGSRAENIAVRSNGDLLITRVDVPEIYLITDPSSSSSPNVTLLHRFNDKLVTSGIAETTPDTFAVITGNTSLQAGVITAVPGSFSVYSVSFSSPTSTTASVSKITDLTTVFANGMSQFSTSAVLVGDFGGGAIVRVDVFTGAQTVVSTDPLLAPREVPVIGNAGVNGLHVFEDHLYFTNTGQRLVGRYPISPTDGTQLGNATVLATPLNATLGWDDFAIAGDGTLFLATAGGNSIERLRSDGTGARIIAGSLNSTDLALPTSAKFGRGESDMDVLYVTTAGGESVPVDGDLIVGAQIVAVDLSGRKKAVGGWR